MVKERVCGGVRKCPAMVTNSVTPPVVTIPVRLIRPMFEGCWRGAWSPDLHNRETGGDFLRFVASKDTTSIVVSRLRDRKR
jgi:hypothetical protein